jgi:hypothetical protein
MSVEMNEFDTSIECKIFRTKTCCTREKVKQECFLFFPSIKKLTYTKLSFSIVCEEKELTMSGCEEIKIAMLLLLLLLF